MAIPRSPALGPESARTNLPPPAPLDDAEQELPITPEIFGTPGTTPGDGNTQRGPSQTENSDPDTPDELTALRQALQEAREVITALQRSRTLSPGVETIHEPKVNKPAEFDGKLSEYSKFISQCLLTFKMCPARYAEDEQKVLFVISYLDGTPRKWARRILEEENHRYRRNFPAFKKALDTMYADRNLKQKALDKLGHVHQTKSVASYAAEFQNTVAPLNLDDESMQSNFYRGLDGEIKKLLVFMPEAKTFDQLVDQCVSIDQRYYAVNHQKKIAEKSSKSHSQSNNNSKKPSNSSSSQSDSTPKQSGGPRSPISEDEKNRRRTNNLCYRCGSPDHRRNDCPLNKGKIPNYSGKPSNGQSSSVNTFEYNNPQLPPENWPSQVTMRPVP